MNNEKGRGFYGWWLVVGCFFLTFAGIGVPINCTPVFLKPVTEALGFMREDFSQIITIAMLCAMFAAPLMGKLMSKYNMRVIMTISTTVLAVALFLFSQCRTLSQFYLCAFFVGIGSAGTHVIPVSMMITNWFKEKRGLAMAIALTGSAVGGLSLVPLTNWLITNNGWQNAFQVLAVVLAICTIPISMFLVRRSPSDMGLLPLGETQESISGPAAELTGLTIGEAVKTSGFWLLGITLFITGFVNFGVAQHIIAYLQDVGHKAVFASNIFAVYMGVLIIGKIILGRISDASLKSGIVFIWLVSALSTVCLLFAQNPMIAIVFGVLFGIANASMTVPPPLLTAGIFGQKDYGTVYGAMNIFVTLGAGLGTKISGRIFDANGGYSLAWQAYTILAIVVIITGLLAVSRGQAKLASVEKNLAA
ncbi:MAG: MFS transporter [Chitinophagales bacterium]